MTTPATFGQPVQNPARDVAPSKTSAEWVEYFRANRQNLLSIPWASPYRLTPTERNAIAHSIRNFQLGESSEGTNLMRVARAYAVKSGDATYVEALKLFIAEEQRHAKDLARFMQQQDMALARRHWTDTLFRKLRKLTNLEMAIVVLLTAELMAMVYYQALCEATHSRVLKQLCTQILRDETEHVRFQSEQLGKMRQNYPFWYIISLERLHQMFFRATLLLVWLDHRKVFRASGYTFWRFCHDAGLEFNNAMQMTRRQLGKESKRVKESKIMGDGEN